MFVLIFLLVIPASIGILLAIFPISYKDLEGNPARSRGLAFVPLAIIVVTVLVTGWTSVPPKNVGVVTTFGSVSENTLSPGFHLKLPWQSKTNIDATIQTDRYHGDSCIQVQLGDGSTSCISITNSWRVHADKANEVYADYRADDPTQQFRDAVVSTQLISSAVVVARTYNPIESLKVVDPGTSATPPSFGPDYVALANAIKKDLIERTKGLADIESLNVTSIPLSDSTQGKINAFTAEVAETRRQQQAQLTKAAEAAGNLELAKSLRNDPNLLISKCLDIVAEGKVTLPQTFTCAIFGGSGTTPVYNVNK